MYVRFLVDAPEQRFPEIQAFATGNHLRGRIRSQSGWCEDDAKAIRVFAEEILKETEMISGDPDINLAMMLAILAIRCGKLHLMLTAAKPDLFENVSDAT
jgi:hypothetical protein